MEFLYQLTGRTISPHLTTQNFSPKHPNALTLLTKPSHPTLRKHMISKENPGLLTFKGLLEFLYFLAALEKAAAKPKKSSKDFLRNSHKKCFSEEFLVFASIRCGVKCLHFVKPLRSA